MLFLYSRTTVVSRSQEHDEPILKSLTDINLSFIGEEKPSDESTEDTNETSMVSRRIAKTSLFNVVREISSSTLYEKFCSLLHEKFPSSIFLLVLRRRLCWSSSFHPMLISVILWVLFISLCKGSFTRSIFCNGIVILVYKIHLWQSMQQDIRLWFAAVRPRCSSELNTYAKIFQSRDTELHVSTGLNACSTRYDCCHLCSSWCMWFSHKSLQEVLQHCLANGKHKLYL